MSRHFMIVVPTGGQYEVGLADGVYPWTHQATCNTREHANTVCTLLAMHYKVPSRTLDAALEEKLAKRPTQATRGGK
jgi:hypothetical protein